MRAGAGRGAVPVRGRAVLHPHREVQHLGQVQLPEQVRPGVGSSSVSVDISYQASPLQLLLHGVRGVRGHQHRGGSHRALRLSDGQGGHLLLLLTHQIYLNI